MEVVLTLSRKMCGNVTMSAYFGVNHVVRSAMTQTILFAMEVVLTLSRKMCGNATMSAYLGVIHVVRNAISQIR